MSRPPAAALVIDEGQRVALEGLAASQAAPHRQVQRAKALLLAADGVANSHIAQRIGVSVGTVRAWRDRLAEDGLAKLGQVRRWRGRKPSISEEQIAEIVELTLHSKPKGHTHWSCRTMADTGGASLPGRTPQPVEGGPSGSRPRQAARQLRARGAASMHHGSWSRSAWPRPCRRQLLARLYPYRASNIE